MSVCIVVRSQDNHCQNKEKWANRTSSITHIPGYKDAILCGLCNVNVSILVFFFVGVFWGRGGSRFIFFSCCSFYWSDEIDD